MFFPTGMWEELFGALGKSCSLGQLCMGCPELVKAWLVKSLAWKCPMVRLSSQSPSALVQSFPPCFPPANSEQLFLFPFLPYLADTNSKTQLYVVPAWERKAKLPHKILKISPLLAQLIKAWECVQLSPFRSCLWNSAVAPVWIQTQHGEAVCT